MRLTLLAAVALVTAGAAFAGAGGGLKASGKVKREAGETELIVTNTGSRPIRWLRFRPAGYKVRAVGFDACRTSSGDILCDRLERYRLVVRPGRGLAVLITRTEPRGRVGGGWLWVDDDDDGRTGDAAGPFRVGVAR